MDIKYNVVKLKDGSTEEIKDYVSVEEPLEMNLKYKVDGKWVTRSIIHNNENTRKWWRFNIRLLI